MQAVILAAGKSTRTYPLTLTRPKPLLKVANKTIIEHNLEQLQGMVDEAIIVIGYLGDMIRDTIKDKFGKIKIKYVVQEEQDGNGAAMMLVKDMLKDSFIVMNADDLVSGKDIENCISHNYCILAKHVEDLSNFGELIPDDKMVKGFKEKPGPRAGLASTGMLVLDKKIFEHKLERSIRGEYEIVDFIKYLIDKGEAVFFEEVSGYWLPITYPWSILDANEFMLKKIKPKKDGTIEKGATIKGDIIVGRGTLVRAGSYIEGPVVIGENCKIGPNCYIRAYTSIGNDSKVGNAVEIKNSVIGDNTSIGHLSYVGDSVIGDNVNFGAGTITANLRHDDLTIKSPIKGDMVDSNRRKLGAIIADDVHTGVNTSIYPGRKIWPERSTLPGKIVDKDLE